MERSTPGAPSEERAAAPVGTTGEQPSGTDDASTDLDSVDNEQLLAALEDAESGESSVVADEPTSGGRRNDGQGGKLPHHNNNNDHSREFKASEEGSEPKDEDPPEGEEDPDEEEEPDDEPDEQPEDTSKPNKIRKRVSLGGLPSEQQELAAKAIQLVRENKAPDIASAVAQLSGGTEQPKAEEGHGGKDDGGQKASDASADRDAQVAPEVREIQSKIAALREQRRRAIEDFDTSEQARITDEIEAASLDLIRAERRAEQDEQRRGEFEKQYEEAVDEVAEKYPDLEDTDSAFYRALDDRITAAQAREDPALKDPRFIVEMANDIASMLRVDPKSKGAKGAAPRSARTRPQKVGGTLAPGANSAPRRSPDQLRKMIQEAPLEELEEALFDE